MKPRTNARRHYNYEVSHMRRCEDCRRFFIHKPDLTLGELQWKCPQCRQKRRKP